jgi:L-threonylcarbamoyladenylate synthase
MLQEEINSAAQAIVDGKVLLYPTDTVWGLGCDANNEAAIQRVLKLKQSTLDKPLIVLVADTDQLYKYVAKIPELAWDLIELSEKPITIVYPEGKNVAPSLLGTDGSLAIRVVKNPFCIQMIRKAGRAITSTSANLSGSSAPNQYRNINEVIMEGAEHIVDYLRKEKLENPPSSIIKVGYDGEVKIIRK